MTQKTRFDEISQRTQRNNNAVGDRGKPSRRSSYASRWRYGADKKEIADAFSDNVTINPNDEKSGIIIPDLKNDSSQKYLYMMVPVSDNLKPEDQIESH